MIDPVIVSDACTDEFISDHKAAYIAIQISIKMSPSYYREVWNYKNADTERLNQLMRTYDLDSIIKDICAIGEASTNFTDLFLKFYKECVPCKNVLIRQNDKPWYNPESDISYDCRIGYGSAFKTKRERDHILFKLNTETK